MATVRPCIAGLERGFACGRACLGVLRFLRDRGLSVVVLTLARFSGSGGVSLALPALVVAAA